MSLSQSELSRYSRHLILPEVGKLGQETLKASSVLVVGAGGLGCPLLTYLAAAGVGTIGIIDFDVVDESNLQRQVLYATSDIGKSKVDVAKQKLLDLNPHIHVNTYQEPLTSDNAIELFSQYDVIADGTDNFATRYLVNDACVLAGKPNVYGSIFRFEGQITVFNYQDGPNYRCLYQEPPPPGLVPSCAEGGVLGVLPGVVATLQANEVIKVLLNIGNIASGRLILFDALQLSFREVSIKKRNDYEIKELIDYNQFCGVNEMTNNDVDDITVFDLKEKFDKEDTFELIDVREPHEYDICSIESAVLIPMGDLEDSLESLDKSKSYVVHCKSGGRSARAVAMMKEYGFQNVVNLAGGILSWADNIDTALNKY
ncbi:molybdenum cofactor biosynthesis protein MoeB [bacterium]|nr:molybdenum cofactor biosynthesis protein MoeB [Actinomycetota bacterium]MBE32697.1 molybdenum cofactor biosynthesis protein MoeB [bacterium]|tara:strand:+ start:15680 stop:16792 length:1113 start_codon:yes stop_codon:yes gene_type:complete